MGIEGRPVLRVAILFAAVSTLSTGIPAYAEDPPEFSLMWGTHGSGEGEFMSPWAVTVDRHTGHIYVADEDNHRVQKFDSQGNFIMQFGSFCYGRECPNHDEFGTCTCANPATAYRCHDFEGCVDPDGDGPLALGDGQLFAPRGIAVDPATADVYVSDVGNNHITRFDSNGNFIAKWGETGGPCAWCDPGPGEFWFEYDIAVDSSGDVYVADLGNRRVQKFTSEGTPLEVWPHVSYPFLKPAGLAIDARDQIFLVDYDMHVVMLFDSRGRLRRNWGEYGTGDGQFRIPTDVEVDPWGDVYVADMYNHRIQKFDARGAFLTSWGGGGNAPGRFVHPWGIAVDAQGYVYVADRDNHRIQKFGPSAHVTKPHGRNNPPVASCNDATVSLDAHGTATIAVADIDGGTWDPDGDRLELSLSDDGLSCSDLGANPTTLTATDPSGASDSCTAVVTVVDDLPPSLTADTHDITPSDAPITFTVQAQDNCGEAVMGLVSFSCDTANGSGRWIDKELSCIVSIDGSLVTIEDAGGMRDIITISGSATDPSGNVAAADFFVHVTKK